jgi:hypothetical protein
MTPEQIRAALAELREIEAGAARMMAVVIPHLMAAALKDTDATLAAAGLPCADRRVMQRLRFPDPGAEPVPPEHNSGRRHLL